MPSQSEHGGADRVEGSATVAAGAARPSQRAEGVTPQPPPAWLVGSALLPFGTVVGFTVTAFPFLLSRLPIPVHCIADTSAIVMSPTFWGFLLCPLLDTGLTRRAYGWLMAILAAMAVAAALWLVSPDHLTATTALLLLGELATVLYAGAITGWTTEFTTDDRRGSVSGWTNVANLGGGALGSLLLMSLATVVSTRWLGLILAAFVLLGTAATASFPAPRRSLFGFRQIFSDALHTAWRTAKRGDCLIGFALFLSPAGAAAAMNLFSALGGDFHASERVVIAVTGAGCAISASLGALGGGYAANRVSRARLFLLGGAGTATVALCMAFLPQTQPAFIAGAILYSGLTGVVLAAFNALAYQLVGQTSAVASTQLGLFLAALNAAIVYMTWADGQGYKHFGIRGLFLIDGLSGLLSIIPLLWLVHRGTPLLAKRHEEASILPSTA